MITARVLLTEGGVLAVFFLGLAVARIFRQHWHLTEIVVMYVLGLLFEILTAPLWNYHNIFLVFPFWFENDISILFPLGWAGWVIATTTISERLWKVARVKGWLLQHVVLMAVWLLIGGTAETVFYRIGMIEYATPEHAGVLYLLGQVTGLPPTMVLSGYGGIPPLVSQFFLWLERDLEHRRSRGS